MGPSGPQIPGIPGNNSVLDNDFWKIPLPFFDLTSTNENCAPPPALTDELDAGLPASNPDISPKAYQYENEEKPKIPLHTLKPEGPLFTHSKDPLCK
jgi:hypothetical protein